MKEIFHAYNGFAGVRTIVTELRARGITASGYAVRRTMDMLRLKATFQRRRKRTTITDPNAHSRGDLMQRRFIPPVPTTHLCGDITYIRTKQGWLYLATVIDLSTRMVIGWQVTDQITTQLVIDAMSMACNGSFVAGNTIFHSDRGSQYTSAKFKEFADRHDTRLSVGKAGVCWDNAVTESFFHVEAAYAL